jgi:hypothetical protein
MLPILFGLFEEDLFFLKIDGSAYLIRVIDIFLFDCVVFIGEALLHFEGLNFAMIIVVCFEVVLVFAVCSVFRSVGDVTELLAVGLDGLIRHCVLGAHFLFTD